MDSSSTAGENLQQKILGEADAWLEKAGETGYTLGACTRKQDSWYAVEVDAGQADDYCVYVRLTPDGSEVRDDRVLAALSRELTAQTRQLVPETAVCAAWVNFCAGMPAQAWYPTDTLETVAAAEALCADWYLLVPASQADTLAGLAADLAVELRGQGWVGTIHAAGIAEEELAVLAASSSDRPALAKAAEAGSWVRVSPDDTRTRDELAAAIEQD